MKRLLKWCLYEEYAFSSSFAQNLYERNCATNQGA